jgi:NADH dehydrogenase
LKTIEDALEMRRRILLAYELAEREAALTGHHRPLNFVVVGAGPTGVELAGTLAEIARKSLPEDFRNIQPAKTRVLLVEAGPSVLSAYPDDLRQSAVKQLQHLGVEVRTNSAVTDIRPGEVSIGQEVVPAAAVLWAAGVSASPLGAALGAPVDRAGRVLVEPDLSISGHREVFVIGDLASLKDAAGKPLPGIAPVAMQQGKCVARRTLARRFSLCGQGFSSDHWPRGCCRTIRQGTHLRLPGLAVVAVHPHPVPDRLPQSCPGDVPVGMELSHLRAFGAADHRRIEGNLRSVDGVCRKGSRAF